MLGEQECVVSSLQLKLTTTKTYHDCERQEVRSCDHFNCMDFYQTSSPHLTTLKPPLVKVDLWLRGGRASRWSCSLVLLLFRLMRRRINTTGQLRKVTPAAMSPVQLSLTQVLLLDVGELISQPLVFTSVLAHPVVQHSHLCCQRLQKKTSRLTMDCGCVLN